MGNRGLLGFILGDGARHGAYTHWDAYVEGLGVDMAKFILSLDEEGWGRMAALVEDITWVDESSTPKAPADLQERYSNLGFSDLHISEQKLEDWSCLLYKVQGGKALPAIQSGDLKHLVEASTCNNKFPCFALI